ncbi:MAG: BrnT family toxin [Acidobacteriota bacterium]
MRFEWDDSKEVINVRKHGVDFDEAAETFYDPYHLVTVRHPARGQEL